MDPLDRVIIEALLDRDQTVHELSKTIYKTSDQTALRGHNSTLRYRLRSLAEDGLVRKREGRHGRYFVPLDDIVYGHAKVVVQRGRESLEIDLGKVLVTQRDGVNQVLTLK